MNKGATLATLVVSLIFVGCGEKSPVASVDIWTAAKNGDIAALEKHMAAGKDINVAARPGGETPLMIAALTGQLEAAQWLVGKGADINAANRERHTALHYATFFCYRDIVAMLIENKAEMNPLNYRGETPLDSVTRTWNPSLRELYSLVGGLIGTKFDVDQIKRVRPEVAELIRKNGGEHNPELDVFVAARTGHLAVIEKYLAAGGHIEARDPLNHTLLINAASLGQTEVIEFLIKKGADMGATYGDGATALHGAAVLGRREAVELLIKKGANLSLKTDKGQTAFDMVSATWTRDLETQIGSAGQVLQHLFDTVKIKQGRPEMAALLRQHMGGQAAAPKP